jgi:DNA helicase-2/ATP-dependent DNA helicase PcrA
VVGGQVVRGRIDAVYADRVGGEDGFLVVDWKTNQRASADALQLGLYRQAWADLHDVPVERVRAAFYYVRTGEVVEPEDLPGRDEIEALLTGGVSG